MRSIIHECQRSIFNLKNSVFPAKEKYLVNKMAQHNPKILNTTRYQTPYSNSNLIKLARSLILRTTKNF